MYTCFFNYVSCVFVYTRRAEADYYIYRRSSSDYAQSLPPTNPSLRCERSHMRPPLFDSQTGFKIDLYIFIYAYIKKGTKRKGERQRVGWAGLGRGRALR